MSLSRSIRWSGKGIGNSRQRLHPEKCFTRQFSINTTGSNQRHLKKNLIKARVNSPLSTQQQRSLSLFGWGSSKPSEEISSSPSAPQSTPTAIVDSPRTVKASHATSDSPDPSILQAQPVSEIEPKPLQALEEAITKPHGDAAGTELLAETPDLASIPEDIGYLKDVCGLDYGWGPTSLVEFCIEHIHIYSGLTWAASISVFVIVARSLILRRVMVASDQSIRVRELQPILKPMREELTQALEVNDRVKGMQINAEIKAITKEAGVKMSAIFAPMLLQIPLQFGGYRLLRGAGTLPVPAFETETWLWVSNISLSDPWILPALTGLSNFVSLKSNIESGTTTMPQNVLAAMKYGLPFLSFIFVHYQPGVVQIFFFLNSLFSLGQSYLVRNKTVREYFKLAPLPSSKPATGKDSPTAPPQLPGGMNRLRTKAVSQPVKEETIIDVSPNRSWIDNAVDNFKDQRDSALKSFKDTKTSVMGDADERLKKRQQDKRKAQIEKYEYKRRQDLQVEREYRNRSRSISEENDNDVESGPTEVAGMKTTSAFRKQRKNNL